MTDHKCFFNTTDPIWAEDHYHLPSLTRPDMNGILSLIRQKKHSVVHAS